MNDDTTVFAPRPASLVEALGAWCREGGRSVFFAAPRWSGLDATPARVACLVCVALAVVVGLQRLYFPGDATFVWRALQWGWLATVVNAWLCWWLVPRDDRSDASDAPPSAAALFAMLVAQALAIAVVSSALLIPVVRTGWTERAGAIGEWVAWAAWLAPIAWLATAQAKLLWQRDARPRRVRALAIVVCLLAFAARTLQPVVFWETVPTTDDVSAAPLPPPLTQDLIERQAAILPAQLHALQPRRTGTTNVFAITYSPYGDEDVFRRESEMVAGVMRERFGAGGHTVELVNHPETIGTLPWATPANLRRTVLRMAALMNRDEDVLFIHLTSHGARDGVLSTRLWPMTFESLTPALLKGALDEAKVRYRILSVSACYSGSWIAPLADDATLVMTAADADHTSYGCGSGSELTFFGRAMFDEALRRTWSFEDAHAAARVAIAEREREAGKEDGYSNPQIRMGAAIRERLARPGFERAGAAP